MNLKTTLIATTVTGLAAAGASAQTASVTDTNTPPKPRWESSAGVGLTLTKGNSDSVTATANFLTGKKWDMNELSFGADASYGEADSEKNTQAAHGFGQYNRLFSERWYGFGRVEGFYDEVAGVDYRLSMSAGAGYYFVKNDRTTLSAEVGPGYVFEKLSTEPVIENGVQTVPGNIDKEDYATLRIGQKFTHKVSTTTRIWETVEFVPQVSDFENYVLTAELGIETSISKSMSLRISLVDIYRNQPPAGREQNDLRLVAGVQYKF